MTDDRTIERQLGETNQEIAGHIIDELRGVLVRRSTRPDLTLSGVARMAGVPESTFEHWVSGSTADPDGKAFMRALLTVCSLGATGADGAPHVQRSHEAREVIAHIASTISSEVVAFLLRTAAEHTDASITRLAGLDAVRVRHLSKLRDDSHAPRLGTLVLLCLGALWSHSRSPSSSTRP